MPSRPREQANYARDRWFSFPRNSRCPRGPARASLTSRGGRGGFARFFPAFNAGPQLLPALHAHAALFAFASRHKTPLPV